MKQKRAAFWIKLVLALCGLGHLTVYSYIGLRRVSHPFELEWMEGGQVDVVARLLEGKALYVAPSVDYVPFIYGPGYYYAAAPLAKVLGPGLLPLRLLSFLAIWACFGLIADMVRRETKSLGAGLAAAGLFAATYPWSGAWFELARVDSLALALLCAGIWVLRWKRTRLGMVIAGLLLGLSYLTKQSMLVAFTPVCAWALFAYRGRGALVSLAAGGLMALSMAILNRTSAGWFWYFTITLPRLHPLRPEGWWLVLGDLLYVPLGFAVLIALFGIGWGLRQKLRYTSLYFAVLLGTLTAACLSMIHTGAFANVVMPLHAGLALCFGLGTAAAVERLSATTRVTVRAGAGLLVLGALVQLLRLYQDMTPHLPTPADVAAGRMLIAALRGLPGEVLVPDHGLYSSLAGKPRHAHSMAVGDILRSSDAELAGRLGTEIARTLARRRYSAIVLDEVGAKLSVWGGSFDGYGYSRDLLSAQEGLETRVGALVRRPSFLHLPEQDSRE